MTQGPFPLDMGQLLCGPIEHTLNASVISAALRIPLDVLRANVTMDETRTPRVEARVTCHLPEGVADIDPRQPVRLELEAGYGLPDGRRVAAPLASLALRTRVVERPDAIMTLTAFSDEALVMDAAAVSSPESWVGTPLAGILAMVSRCLGSAPQWHVGQLPSTPGVALEGITDRWVTARDLGDQLGCRIWHDGLLTWHVEPVAQEVSPTPSLTLRTGAGGSLTGTTSSLTRDGWANRAVIVYEWRDGVESRRIASQRQITWGPLAAAPGNTVTCTETRSTPTTQLAADLACDAVLRRVASRGRTITATAPAALWLRPGATVALKLPLGDVESHLVSAVTFTWPDGLMTVTTRAPFDLITGNGQE